MKDFTQLNPRHFWANQYFLHLLRELLHSKLAAKLFHGADVFSNIPNPLDFLAFQCLSTQNFLEWALGEIFYQSWHPMEKWRKKVEYSVPIWKKNCCTSLFHWKGSLFLPCEAGCSLVGLEQRNKNIFWIKRHNVMHILRDFSLHNLTSYCQGPGRAQASKY